MAVIRINKTGDYTVMSNTHFKEKEMSLKAKGLLSMMLSLPDNWDYSILGLVALSHDGKGSVMSALSELENFRYLKRTKIIDEKGRFAGYNYDIYEKPYAENPHTEKPYSKNPNTENPPQLNTNESTTKKTNTKYKDNIIAENFETLWKMLKSTPYDRKSKVTKGRKKELYDMGLERTKKAIEVYLKVQDPKFYYKRDNFLNEIIDNYIDKDVSDFQTKRNGADSYGDRREKSEKAARETWGDIGTTI